MVKQTRRRKSFRKQLAENRGKLIASVLLLAATIAGTVFFIVRLIPKTDPKIYFHSVYVNYQSPEMAIGVLDGINLTLNSSEGEDAGRNSANLLIKKFRSFDNHLQPAKEAQNVTSRFDLPVPEISADRDIYFLYICGHAFTKENELFLKSPATNASQDISIDELLDQFQAIEAKTKVLFLDCGQWIESPYFPDRKNGGFVQALSAKLKTIKGENVNTWVITSNQDNQRSLVLHNPGNSYGMRGSTLFSNAIHSALSLEKTGKLSIDLMYQNILTYCRDKAHDMNGKSLQTPVLLKTGTGAVLSGNSNDVAGLQEKSVFLKLRPTENTDENEETVPADHFQKPSFATVKSPVSFEDYLENPRGAVEELEAFLLGIPLENRGQSGQGRSYAKRLSEMKSEFESRVSNYLVSEKTKSDWENHQQVVKLNRKFFFKYTILLRSLHQLFNARLPHSNELEQIVSEKSKDFQKNLSDDKTLEVILKAREDTVKEADRSAKKISDIESIVTDLWRDIIAAGFQDTPPISRYTIEQTAIFKSRFCPLLEPDDGVAIDGNNAESDRPLFENLKFEVAESVNGDITYPSRVTSQAREFPIDRLRDLDIDPNGSSPPQLNEDQINLKLLVVAKQGSRALRQSFSLPVPSLQYKTDTPKFEVDGSVNFSFSFVDRSDSATIKLSSDQIGKFSARLNQKLEDVKVSAKQVGDSEFTVLSDDRDRPTMLERGEVEIKAEYVGKDWHGKDWHKNTLGTPIQILFEPRQSVSKGLAPKSVTVAIEILKPSFQLDFENPFGIKDGSSAPDTVLSQHSGDRLNAKESDLRVLRTLPNFKREFNFILSDLSNLDEEFAVRLWSIKGSQGKRSPLKYFPGRLALDEIGGLKNPSFFSAVPIAEAKFAGGKGIEKLKLKWKSIGSNAPPVIAHLLVLTITRDNNGDVGDQKLADATKPEFLANGDWFSLFQIESVSPTRFLENPDDLVRVNELGTTNELIAKFAKFDRGGIVADNERFDLDEESKLAPVRYHIFTNRPDVQDVPNSLQLKMEEEGKTFSVPASVRGTLVVDLFGRNSIFRRRWPENEESQTESAFIGIRPIDLVGKKQVWITHLGRMTPNLTPWKKITRQPDESDGVEQIVFAKPVNESNEKTLKFQLKLFTPLLKQKPSIYNVGNKILWGDQLEEHRYEFRKDQISLWTRFRNHQIDIELNKSKTEIQIKRVNSDPKDIYRFQVLTGLPSDTRPSSIFRTSITGYDGSPLKKKDELKKLKFLIQIKSDYIERFEGKALTVGLFGRKKNGGPFEIGERLRTEDDYSVNGNASLPEFIRKVRLSEWKKNPDGYDGYYVFSRYLFGNVNNESAFFPSNAMDLIWQNESKDKQIHRLIGIKARIEDFFELEGNTVEENKKVLSMMKTFQIRIPPKEFNQ